MEPSTSSTLIRAPVFKQDKNYCKMIFQYRQHQVSKEVDIPGVAHGTIGDQDFTHLEPPFIGRRFQRSEPVFVREVDVRPLLINSRMIATLPYLAALMGVLPHLSLPPALAG